jgi:hypothetical protein
MWRRRRRIQELEIEVEQGKAERAELRRRLDWFETIAAAAGAAPPGTGTQGTGTQGTALPSTGLPSTGLPSTALPSTAPPRTGQPSTVPAPPPNLLAAARDLRGHDVPVRLDVAGAEVIAIVGGPGDPREWWTAIWHTAGQDIAPQTVDPKEAPA